MVEVACHSQQHGGGSDKSLLLHFRGGEMDFFLHWGSENLNDFDVDDDAAPWKTSTALIDKVHRQWSGAAKGSILLVLIEHQVTLL
jgi:hypothetical protein